MKTKNLKYWLGFSKIYSIGTIHLNKMLDAFGSIDQAWHATTGDLVEISGFTSATIKKFNEEKNSVNIEKLEDEIHKKGIEVITLEDENYPFYLKQIYDPPIVLYIKGSLEKIDLEKCLAIVGSRKSSHYIQEVVKKLVHDMKGSGITIVSGMAEGVDSCAHNAALGVDLATVAVLGSGFDHIYPKSNVDLYKKIINGNGAVITEYYPDTQPLPMRFPRRNRIISGLSQATLVAEATLKSGALITADLCLEQNRELMCIPGNITNPNTEGVNKLIKEGASIITSANDILSFFKCPDCKVNSQFSKNIEIKLLDNEKKLYEILLEGEPVTFDKLIQESRLSAEEMMGALTSMELNGIITQLPGQKFVKNLS